MEFPSDAKFTNIYIDQMFVINGRPLFLKDENGWYLNPEFFK